MNAPTSPAVVTGQFTLLAVDELVPSTTRVQERRRARFTDDNLRELADSLAGGMIEPIVARPRPDLGPFAAEIIAGERRWRAARLAGWHNVPVLVRDCTDEDALRVQLVENLQRQGLDPLDEAEGYAELMQKTGMKPDDLVGLTGKSRSWVYDRLKLLKLPEAAKAALAEGRIDASRALVISRYEGEHAALALELALPDDEGDATFSVRQLEEEMEWRIHCERQRAELEAARANAPKDPQPAPRAHDDGSFKREQEAREAEKAFRVALVKALMPKARGPVTTAELAEIAREELDNLDAEDIEILYAGEAPDPAKMKASDIGFLLRMSRAVQCTACWNDGAALLALAKRLKVDPAKVRAAMKAEAKKPTPKSKK